MLISEINPFVRFANVIILCDWKESVSTYDHRLFFVLDGKAKIYANSREYNAEKNTLFLWKSGTIYRFNIEKPLKLISVNFDFTQKNSQKKNLFPLVKQHFEDLTNVCEKFEFSDCEALNNPIVLYDAAYLLPYLNELIEEQGKKLLYSEGICSAVMKKIVLSIVRNSSFSTAISLNKAEKIIEYIMKNYSKNISNSDVAKEMGYHPYHINRLMKRYTDTTFHKYLLNYRLKKAKNYLINTSFCIYEIAQLCGFDSPYYFTNSFKKQYQITPSEYRRQRKNNV